MGDDGGRARDLQGQIPRGTAREAVYGRADPQKIRASRTAREAELLEKQNCQKSKTARKAKLSEKQNGQKRRAEATSKVPRLFLGFYYIRS